MGHCHRAAERCCRAGCLMGGEAGWLMAIGERERDVSAA